MRSIELLAPARDLESGKAAVDAGADAVYIGGPKFGARQAAGNTVEEVRLLAEYARPFGVKVYAALNTLVFEDELEDARAAANELIDAGVDALIIQDMAFMRMGLDSELHASTQTTNVSARHVRFLEECGFTRVILERGLTLGQIKEIRSQTAVALEFFVHGAICVGFSGQCYLSKSMGPRSGNRGDCMQACRLTYDLEDENGNLLAAGKHMLSVPDLNLGRRIGELMDAGIDSFKIEGRLKDVSYVKNVVAYYRSVIDKEIAARDGFVRSSSGISVPDFTPDPAKSFTRGSSEWMLDGGSRAMASPATPKAIGEFIGTVTEVNGRGFKLDRAHDLVAGDGICHIAGTELRGTNLNGIAGGYMIPHINDGITKGTKIYRNRDRLFEAALGKSRIKRVIAVAARVVAGNTIGLTLTDEDGNTVSTEDAGVYDVAKDGGKMLDILIKQISKSGGTVFDIRKVDVKASDKIPFMPVAAVNELRRRALDMLLEKRMEREPKVVPKENTTYPYPERSLGGHANVTNSLAAQFYREHRVETIEPGLDMRESLNGECVMTTPYCIRREIGHCLVKDAPAYRGKMFLRRGALRYRLDFDCGECLMRLIKE